MNFQKWKLFSGSPGSLLTDSQSEDTSLNFLLNIIQILVCNNGRRKTSNNFQGIKPPKIKKILKMS